MRGANEGFGSNQKPIMSRNGSNRVKLQKLIHLIFLKIVIMILKITVTKSFHIFLTKKFVAAQLAYNIQNITFTKKFSTNFTEEVVSFIEYVI